MLDVAYEPVWAIGASATPTLAEIEAAHAAIREALFRRFGDASRSRRVLYGGAVDRTNAAQLLGVPGVDGLLVGRASLRAAQFLPIVRACQTTAPPLECLPTD
jgi:triosephosphate isomerase